MKALLKCGKPLAMILFLCSVIISCHKEFDQSSPSIEPSEFTINEAQSWFENDYLKSLSAPKVGVVLHREVYWKFAFKHTNKFDNNKNRVVVVPISHLTVGQTSGYRQLWIYKDKDGKPVAQVVEYLYDRKQYPAKTASLDDFSGLMLVRDWNDNLIMGYQIEKNTVKGIVTEFNIEIRSKKNTITRVQKITSPTNPNARAADIICGPMIRCNNWQIDFMTWTVSGFSCLDAYGCVNSYNYLDPAFNGVTVDLPEMTPGSYVGYDGPTRAVLPFGPPSATTMGYQPSMCDGMRLMLQTQGNVDREQAGVLVKEGGCFIMPYGNNTDTTFSIPDTYYDTYGRIVGWIDRNPANDKLTYNYTDWNQYPITT